MTAPTANLLPNGEQQYCDANGKPFSLGSVCHYLPGTLTSKTTWSDAAQTVPNTTPCVTLDAAGRAIIFGTGTYRQRLLDSLGNLIWDKTTQVSSNVIKSVLDYGAVDSGSDDSTAILAAVTDAQLNSGIIGLTGGTYATTSIIGLNNVDQLTLTKTDRPNALGIYVGSAAAPGAQQEPSLWVQTYVKKDTGGATLHQVGGTFNDLEILGSGDFVNPNRGTWHGGMSSATGAGVWNGNQATPLYDTDGDVIGFSAFAHNKAVPKTGRIITGLWAYSEGPVVDSTTFGNLPADNWSVCGIEINIKQNAPDVGFRTALTGKGTSVGLLLQNFVTAGQPVRLWNFGTILAGNPSDSNFAGLDVELWNGHHVGHLVNQINDVGILFGPYAKDGSYGIKFPDTYAGFQTATKVVTALSQAAGLATASVTAHGWATGQNIIIAGANQAGFNTPGGTSITVVDVNTFTYAVDAGTVTPATGTITAAKFQRPKAAIYLGNNVLNWGQYTGGVFNVGDMWRNASRLFWHDGVTAGGREVVGSLGVANVNGTFGKQIHIQLSGVDYYFDASSAATGNEILNSFGVGTSVSNVVTNKIHIQVAGVDYYLLASTSPA